VACRWRFSFKQHKGELTPVFRAVGHRKGSNQLLNTSVGLVRTLVQNELTVHGRLVTSKEPLPSEYFGTQVRSS